MTRRHDERWAVPIDRGEYTAHLEDEFFRLREVERGLQGNIDFLRSERDRLMQAVEELRRERDNAGGEPWGDYAEVRGELDRLKESRRFLSAGLAAAGQRISRLKLALEQIAEADNRGNEPWSRALAREVLEAEGG